MARKRRRRKNKKNKNKQKNKRNDNQYKGGNDMMLDPAYRAIMGYSNHSASPKNKGKAHKTTNGTKYTYKSGCSHVQTPFKIGEYTIYASGSRHITNKVLKDGYYPKDYGVYLDTYTWKNMRSSNISTQGNDTIAEGTDEFGDVMYVTWPDLSTISQKSYNKILDTIVELLKKGTTIEVGCIGAHGRTGTTLAGLLVKIENLKAKEAIDRVKNNYCDEAIETYSQEKMIYTLTGEEAPPNTSSYVGWNDWGGYYGSGTYSGSAVTGSTYHKSKAKKWWETYDWDNPDDYEIDSETGEIHHKDEYLDDDFAAANFGLSEYDEGNERPTLFDVNGDAYKINQKGELVDRWGFEVGSYLNDVIGEGAELYSEDGKVYAVESGKLYDTTTGEEVTFENEHNSSDDRRWSDADSNEYRFVDGELVDNFGIPAEYILEEGEKVIGNDARKYYYSEGILYDGNYYPVCPVSEEDLESGNYSENARKAMDAAYDGLVDWGKAKEEDAKECPNCGGGDCDCTCNKLKSIACRCRKHQEAKEETFNKTMVQTAIDLNKVPPMLPAAEKCPNCNLVKGNDHHQFVEKGGCNVYKDTDYADSTTWFCVKKGCTNKTRSFSDAYCSDECSDIHRANLT